MSIKGTTKLNELAVKDFKVSYEQGRIHLEAKVGFVDSSSGETLAWSTVTGAAWSRQTMTLLEQLRVSIESDLAKRYFVEGAVSGGTLFGETGGQGGLGAHLGLDADAPTI